MSVRVQWGRQGNEVVGSPEELGSLLDRIAVERGEEDAGYRVSISRGEDDWLEIGLGERRSVVFWTGGGWGGQPDVEPLEDDVWFDVGGVPTEAEPVQTRVMPEVACAAAVEYATTGKPGSGLIFGDEYSPYG